MKSFEDVVPKKLFDHVVKKVCDHPLPFFYSKHTAYQLDDMVVDQYNGPCYSSWAHLCYDADPQARHVSPINELIHSALLAAFDKCNEDVKQFYRIRIGLITAQPTNIIHMPHVDLRFPHKTCLLYLNDSDGDTLLYEEKYDMRQQLDTIKYFIKNYKDKEMNILHRSTPKANKMIFFNGDHYHSSSTPTNTPARFAININYR